MFISSPLMVPIVNPLSAKLTKWPNTLKQFVGNLPTNRLNVFGHFVGLAFKELSNQPSDTSDVKIKFWTVFNRLLKNANFFNQNKQWLNNIIYH